MSQILGGDSSFISQYSKKQNQGTDEIFKNRICALNLKYIKKYIGE